MDSIEQPFDSITRIGQELPDTHDKTGLIETDGRSKPYHNGDSPRAESSPLHQDKTTNSLLHGPQNQGLRIIIISSIVFAAAVTVALILTIYLEPKQIHGHAAVACDDVRCSEDGLQILKDGGNAVDAAVAVAFCLGVVDPAHSGIGGGGFAIVHDHKFTESWGYDFRETAPATITPAKFRDATLGAVGVPGFVKGLAKMHEEHGKLPWRDVLEPARRRAEEGFAVSEALARVLRNSTKSDFLNTPLGEIFLDDQGNFKNVNDTIQMQNLARTLKRIQDDQDSLYNGALMDYFINDMGDDGIIERDDMRNYTVGKPTMLETKFKELTVLGLPPPAGGAVVALMLNMVDKLNWKEKQGNDSLTYHQLIETFKFAFGHRGLLGDPAFNATMKAITDDFVSAELAEQLVKKINNNKTLDNPQDYGPALSSSNGGGTSHLSVIDSSELMVSATLSINHHFGSKVMLKNTGILLNDQLNDFDAAFAANTLEPGKRPLSSMSPTILFNKEHPCAHRVIIGGDGGMKIATGVVESVVNSVVFKMNISSAIAAPRVHDQLSSFTLVEEGIPKKVQTDLSNKGHHLIRWPVSDDSSIIMGVEKTNDNIRTYSDYRKFGGTAKF